MAIFSALAGSIAQSGAQAGGDMAYGAATQAANQNLQEAQKARAAASPWTSSGTSAVGKITNLLGLGTLTQQGNNQGIYWVDPTDAKGAQTRAMADFQTDPGYQFRVDEGAKTLDVVRVADGVRVRALPLRAGDGGANFVAWAPHCLALAFALDDAGKAPPPAPLPPLLTAGGALPPLPPPTEAGALRILFF